jgi:hypothetical protein
LCDGRHIVVRDAHHVREKFGHPLDVSFGHLRRDARAQLVAYQRGRVVVAGAGRAAYQTAEHAERPTTAHRVGAYGQDAWFSRVGSQLGHPLTDQACLADARGPGHHDRARDRLLDAFLPDCTQSRQLARAAHAGCLASQQLAGLHGLRAVREQLDALAVLAQLEVRIEQTGAHGVYQNWTAVLIAGRRLRGKLQEPRGLVDDVAYRLPYLQHAAPGGEHDGHFGDEVAYGQGTTRRTRGAIGRGALAA